MKSFADFNISTHIYKTVNSHDILTDVMVPKNIIHGKYPVWIRFHGGYLITGARNDENFIAPWMITFAHLQSVILVSADYRLMPESNGISILEDTEDLWNWVHTQLVGILTPSGIEPDLERIVLSGESSGAYLAIQLGFNHADSIRAIVAGYPIIDLKDKFYTTAYIKDMGAPMMPLELLTNHLAGDMKVISNAVWPARMELIFTMVQQGRFAEFLGENDILYPIERSKEGAKLPTIFIYHGSSDTTVPYEGSVKFVKMLEENGTVKGKLCFESIADAPHAFDPGAQLTDDWLVNGLAVIEDALK
ncbi:Alpha/Beta hydrolase protein [Lentinula edodes]|nr:Alpha/Beta hydrolase protein [Lentinula edodes]